MRTFLAFKLNESINQSEIVKRIDMVKNYYEKRFIKYKLSIEQHIYKNIGFFNLDSIQSPINFETKVKRDKRYIMTYFPPLDIAESKKSYSENMFEISSNIKDEKSFLNQLKPPFLFSEIDEDKEELTIYSDLLGLNRLYKLENDKGVFWSNRPAALLIFTGEKAKLDLKSWKTYAVAGWFMNASSPFENITRVEPSVFFSAKSNEEILYRKIKTDGLNYLKSLCTEKNNTVSQINKDILKNLNSFNTLWKVGMQVDISGGKDSRVGAASILKSGIDNFTFRTITDIDEELNTSKKLLKSINNNTELNILEPHEYLVNQPPLLERVDRLLYEFDGDFTTVMMNSPIIETNTFNDINKTLLNGFGGEIAKGAFYSNQRWIDKLKEKGNDAPYYRLSTHYIKLGCVTKDAEESMKNEVRAVLNDGESYNIKGLKLLDYFHFIERFRRWSPLGGLVNSYSPFASPYFISAALNAKPADNMNTILHSNIVRNLIPEWENIPFFKATPEQSKEKDKKNLRLWQTKDRYEVESILCKPELWNDIFIEKDVLDLWDLAKNKGIPNYKETLFQRVLLRAQFNNHIDKINEAIN